MDWNVLSFAVALIIISHNRILFIHFKIFAEHNMWRFPSHRVIARRLTYLISWAER